MRTLRDLADELSDLADVSPTGGFLKIGQLPVVTVNWELSGNLVERIDSPELVEIGELRATFGLDCVSPEFADLPDNQFVWAFNYK